MEKPRDDWRFLRARAAQLYQEGNVRGALRMMRTLNRLQCEMFRRFTEENVNERKIVSTR